MDDDEAKTAVRKLLAYCQVNDWAGYDPYDALNSRLFTALPFLDSKLPRLLATQALKRSPIDLRRLLLIPRTGDFNWLFISSMMLLGFKWSTIDQAILQRAFGAKSPRVGAKGMVIAGIITTPMALLYILPGLAVAKLHPAPFGHDNNGDLAIPWFLSTQLPLICKSP